jgi:hypothetical protein
MTLRDLTNQFYIQGAYCIKRWVDEHDYYAVLAQGTDFECDYHKFNEAIWDMPITYMYAVDGVLNIEVE